MFKLVIDISLYNNYLIYSEHQWSNSIIHEIVLDVVSKSWILKRIKIFTVYDIIQSFVANVFLSDFLRLDSYESELFFKIKLLCLKFLEIIFRPILMFYINNNCLLLDFLLYKLLIILLYLKQCLIVISDFDAG